MYCFRATSRIGLPWALAIAFWIIRLASSSPVNRTFTVFIVCLQLLPKAPDRSGASVNFQSFWPVLLATSGWALISKELGSSRSPLRGLGDHFADPELAGVSGAVGIAACLGAVRGLLRASAGLARRWENFSVMLNLGQ